MNDSQSKRLADWLDGRGSHLGLDPDICQTIYVFKPELAPSPQVDVDGLLTHVDRGPFCLNDASDHDEESDLEQLFGVAPQARPNLQVGAIFDSLTQGPLMAGVDDAVPDNVVPLFKRFRGPAFGAFLAAACALIVLLPTDFQVNLPEEEPITSTGGFESSEDPPSEIAHSEEVFRESSASEDESQIETAEQPKEMVKKRKKRVSPKPKSGLLRRGKSKSSSVGRLDSQKESPSDNRRSMPQSKEIPQEQSQSVVKKDVPQSEFESTAAAQSVEDAAPVLAPGMSMGTSLQKKGSANRTLPQNQGSTDRELQQLRSQAWAFPAIRNPLMEPLRSQVKQAKTVADLLKLMGDGQIDDDLEIAFRIANRDSARGETALKMALRSSGGATRLRRRAWAKLGDILMLKGDRTAAIRAYRSALGRK